MLISDSESCHLIRVYSTNGQSYVFVVVNLTFRTVLSELALPLTLDQHTIQLGKGVLDLDHG
jgi:hypothetical protein